MPARTAIREDQAAAGAPRLRARRSRWAASLAALALAGLAAGCSATPTGDANPDPSSSTGTGAARSSDVVASGLDAPWSVAFHGQVALVSERDTARILELTDGATREVGRIQGVVPRGEGGLLGIAVRDDQLYAYFTAAGENRIERFALTGQAGSLGLGTPELVIGGLPAAGYHNGGRIAFGPDGMLYATVGDAGSSGSAQQRESLGGKILRLNPDGTVPDDNPFPGSPVYSLGHRNPQGLAWGPDGTLYASEFGQNTWDELNVIEPGRNYGWPLVEGVAGRDGFEDPVQQWSPADASPSGIAVSDGAVHIANLRGQRLRDVPLDDLAGGSDRFVRDHGRLRDVVHAPDGALWVVTSNTDGRGNPGPEDDQIIRVVS